MKILIGHDGSPAADDAVADLRNAGLPQKAEALILLACQPLPPLQTLAPDGWEAQAMAVAYRDALIAHETVTLQCRRRAETAARKLRKRFQKWKISTRVVKDSPAHALLDAAEKWRPDLLVLGSRGWNEFGKLLVGSVADKVMNQARCAVRLGRPRADRKGPPRLLIAYDGSPHADAAVKLMAARDWPKGTRAELVAVSEIRFRIDGLIEPPGGGSPWRWMEGRLAKAADSLAKAGIRVATLIVEGDPARSLLERAKTGMADAVVLGSHGYRGLRRIMVGSVSSSVAAHAPCSVELVHLPGKSAKR